jgi:hypothetical protein
MSIKTSSDEFGFTIVFEADGDLPRNHALERMVVTALDAYFGHEDSEVRVIAVGMDMEHLIDDDSSLAPEVCEGCDTEGHYVRDMECVFIDGEWVFRCGNCAAALNGKAGV